MAGAPERPLRVIAPALSDASLPPRRVQWGDAQYLTYFHPQLTSMTQVKETMLPYIKQDGSFLVRISMSSEKTFTASVVHHSAIKHFKILRKNQQYYLQMHLFNSLEELIDYYYYTDVPNVENIQNVRLLNPIVNTEKEKHPKPRTPSLSGTSVSPTTAEPRRHSEDSGTSNSRMRRITSSKSITSQGSSRSIASLGSSMDDEDPTVTYNKIFPHDRTDAVRQLPPPPGSKLIPEQVVPRRRHTQTLHDQTGPALEPMPGRQKSLDQRPPAPIPVEEEDSSGDSNGIYNGVYYTCIKQTIENKLPMLLEQLSVASEIESTHCECGLDLDLSQLPMGWSVHISRESDSGYGRPFFVSSTQVTCWDLPKEIYLELKRQQQKFIKFLCDNYEKGNPPPDENTQMEWSSSSSGSHPDTPAAARHGQGGASSADRDSTGSNTGASPGGLVSRGITDMTDGSGAQEAT